MSIKRIVVEFGMGTDLRGEDYTKAASRALSDALSHNALSVYQALGYTLEEMLVEVTIGITQPEMVDKNILISQLPYGTVTVTVNSGGLEIAHEESDNLIIIANAAVIVSLDIDSQEDISDVA